MEAEFVVQCHAKVFKTVHYFNSLVIDGDGVLGCGGEQDEFFCFCDVEVEVVIFTPLGEVQDSAVVVQDGVIVCKQG